jgi:fatty acid desaturase
MAAPLSPLARSAAYLDDSQRRQIAAARASWTWRTDWPTWLLICAVYVMWFGVASQARRIGLSIAIPLLAIASGWYMSLQHELLHGHPTRSPLVNSLFGFAPLAVWFPYAIYRRLHLAHHATTALTDPDVDPESFLICARDWLGAGSLARLLWVVRATFAGRVVIGPAMALVAMTGDAINRVARGDLRDVPAWTAHGLALAALATWLDRKCGVPVTVFVVGVGYPALSITSIRSFQEHRYDADPARRSVINHASWLWRLLFLNNNLHAVHHDLPSVPWFALPAVYRRHQAAYDARNAGYVVHGYGEWWRRFAFVPTALIAYEQGGGYRTDESFSGSASREASKAASTPMCNTALLILPLRIESGHLPADDR